MINCNDFRVQKNDFRVPQNDFRVLHNDFRVPKEFTENFKTLDTQGPTAR